MKNTKTRKSLSIILAVIMIMSTMSLMTIGSFAETSGDFEYYVFDDGTAEIQGYTGSDNELIIPSVLDNHTVVSIGWEAFSECITLKRVTIPEGVEEIGYRAFYNCTSLISVELPETLEHIENQSFEDCKSLKSITIPDNVTEVEFATFRGCESLSSIKIGKGVKGLGEDAFSGCSSLTEINIPDNVEYIEEYAFWNCSELESIELGNGITSIGAHAFGDTAFYETDSNWTEDVLYIDNYLIEMASTSKKASYAIKNGTFLVADGAFSRCTSLADLKIPDSVRFIGKHAFCYGDECTKLYKDEQNWDNGVLYIDNCLIRSNLKSGVSYSVKNGTRLIADDAFSESGIISLYIPATVKSIGNYALFLNSLENVTIEEGVEYIGRGAFYENDLLKNIVIPKSVKHIGLNAIGYTFNADYDQVELYDGIVISGYAGSAAETYAKDNNIEFVALDAPEPTKYPDVADSDWYNEAAYYNAERGWITGYKNGKFGGGDQLKRQDFVVILARIAGADLTAYQNVQSKMPDVVKGSYYAAAVNWAVDNGIIGGYTSGAKAGKFGVGDPITREQVCVILYRFMGSPAVTGADNTLKPFADANKISSFAKDAVVWAIQNGVISGKKPDTLAPTVTASRAEIATIVMRMDKAGMFTE